MENMLGELLLKKRTREGLSLREFAKNLNISHAYLAKLEKGIDPRTGNSVEPTIEVLNKIGIGLNIDISVLLKMVKQDIYNIDTEVLELSKLFEDFLKTLSEKKISTNGEIIGKEQINEIYCKINSEFELILDLLRKTP